MVTIVQVMDGIETRLDTISGLRVTEYTPDQINPPQAFVGVPEVPDYWQAMRQGLWELQPTVTVLVSAALDRAGQRALAAYADPTGAGSVVAAIEGDDTLGGVVDQCTVRAFRPLSLEEVGTIGYYGGVFELLVHAST